MPEDYDNTLIGQYIRAIENLDSTGFKDGKWYQSKRKIDDPNSRGFGIDIKHNKEAVKLTKDRDGQWLTEDEERGLRNSYINYCETKLDEHLPNPNVSEAKKAMAIGMIYRGDAPSLWKNTALKDAYYNGSDEDFSKAIDTFYNQKKTNHYQPERAKNSTRFMQSYQKSKMPIVSVPFVQVEQPDATRVARPPVVLPIHRKGYGGMMFGDGGYTVGEYADAIYQNAVEEPYGDPSPHYNNVNEELLRTLVPDARGHYDDAVKLPNHPSSPSRGTFNGRYFDLTDEGMQNPNYTLFDLIDNGDADTTLRYNGDYVLPEVTVTPEGNYYDDTYNNIRIRQKADGGSLETPKQWDDLSLRERSDVMAVAVKHGFTSLKDIRDKWNEFAEGSQSNQSDWSNQSGSYKMYGGGGYMPSKAVRDRIALWEGSSMKTNRSFEAEAKDFNRVIPQALRDSLSQEQLDALYSYGYNVGMGNLKKRVLPTLRNYASGRAGAEDVASSMWASGDKYLRGLQKRRSYERNQFVYGSPSDRRQSIVDKAIHMDLSFLPSERSLPIPQAAYPPNPTDYGVGATDGTDTMEAVSQDNAMPTGLSDEQRAWNDYGQYVLQNAMSAFVPSDSDSNSTLLDSSWFKEGGPLQGHKFDGTGSSWLTQGVEMVSPEHLMFNPQTGNVITGNTDHGVIVLPDVVATTKANGYGLKDDDGNYYNTSAANYPRLVGDRIGNDLNKVLLGSMAIGTAPMTLPELASGFATAGNFLSDALMSTRAGQAFGSLLHNPYFNAGMTALGGGDAYHTISSGNLTYANAPFVALEATPFAQVPKYLGRAAKSAATEFPNLMSQAEDWALENAARNGSQWAKARAFNREFNRSIDNTAFTTPTISPQTSISYTATPSSTGPSIPWSEARVFPAVEDARNFAKKYNYTLSDNPTLGEIADMYNQHNTFYRGTLFNQAGFQEGANKVAKAQGVDASTVTPTDVLKYFTTHGPEGFAWVSPRSNALMYGNARSGETGVPDAMGRYMATSEVRRPWKTPDPLDWRKSAEFTIGTDTGRLGDYDVVSPWGDSTTELVVPQHTQLEWVRFVDDPSQIKGSHAADYPQYFANSSGNNWMGIVPPSERATSSPIPLESAKGVESNRNASTFGGAQDSNDFSKAWNNYLDFGNVEDGTFSFKGFEDNPIKMHLQRAKAKGYDTSDIQVINLNEDTPERTAFLKDMIGNSKVAPESLLKMYLQHLNNNGHAGYIIGTKYIVHDGKGSNMTARVSHEIDHFLHEPDNPVPDGTFFPRLTNLYGNKFTQYNNTEVAARGSQLHDYFGHTGTEPLTEKELLYARDHYEKDTGLDNQISEMLWSTKDMKGLAKWLTKNATSLFIPFTWGQTPVHKSE